MWIIEISDLLSVDGNNMMYSGGNGSMTDSVQNAVQYNSEAEAQAVVDGLDPSYTYVVVDV